MNSPSLVHDRRDIDPADSARLGSSEQAPAPPASLQQGRATLVAQSPRSRVLIVSPYVFGVGGVAVAISCISRELARRGCQVVHLTRGHAWFIQRHADSTQPPTYTVYFRQSVATLKSQVALALHLPIHCMNLASFLVRQKITHVWIQYPIPAHLGLVLACRSLGIKVCITFQGSDAHRLPSLRPDEALHLRWVLRLAHTITAVSQSLADKVTDFFPALRNEPLAIIPNGTPLSVATLERPACHARKIRIAAVGKLIPRKGFDVLIRSLALLKEQASEFECRIIGEGPERDPLRQLASELGVDHMVELAGNMDHPSVLSELQSTDIFVLSSRAEGAALVLAEAMSSGCAVISTAVDGALEAITPGVNGILVDVESPEELASAIGALLADHELRLQLAAGGLASSRELLWDRITERYLQAAQVES